MHWADYNYAIFDPGREKDTRARENNHSGHSFLLCVATYVWIRDLYMATADCEGIKPLSKYSFNRAEYDFPAWLCRLLVSHTKITSDQQPGISLLLSSLLFFFILYNHSSLFCSLNSDLFKRKNRKDTSWTVSHIGEQLNAHNSSKINIFHIHQ